MEETNKKLLFVAIALALVTSGLIFTYMKSFKDNKKEVQYVKIYVAARNIEPRSTIVVEDLKEIQIEQSLILENSLTSQEELLNKLTVETIFKDEQIVKERLAGDDNTTLSFDIPKGKRAITINVDEASAVGYFVQPGDYVDIVSTFDKTGQDDKAISISKTILQNILVLGVGQQRDVAEMVQNKTEKKKLGSSKSSDDTEAIKSVTLAINPEDAEKVSGSEQFGTLRLTLRPVGDNNVINSLGTTKEQLIQ